MKTVLSWGVFAAFCLSLWATMGPTAIGGPASYVIVDGTSMEPTYEHGDLVVARVQDEYRIGDVIAYDAPVDVAFPVIHRIVGVDTNGFVTRGDNRDEADGWRAPEDAIHGAAWLRVPRGGALLLFLRQPAVPIGLLAGWLALVYMGRRERRESDEEPTTATPAATDPFPVIAGARTSSPSVPSRPSRTTAGGAGGRRRSRPKHAASHRPRGARPPVTAARPGPRRRARQAAKARGPFGRARPRHARPPSRGARARRAGFVSTAALMVGGAALVVASAGVLHVDGNVLQVVTDVDVAALREPLADEEPPGEDEHDAAADDPVEDHDAADDPDDPGPAQDDDGHAGEDADGPADRDSAAEQASEDDTDLDVADGDGSGEETTVGDQEHEATDAATSD